MSKALDDQAKAIAEIKAEFTTVYRYGAPQVHDAIDRAVSISRASKGSGEGIAELVARGMWQVAIAFGTKTGSFDEASAIAISGDDWHQYLPDAEKLIAEHPALSPPATPQEDLQPYKDELLKIAEMVGEADDPFAAWESIAPFFDPDASAATPQAPEDEVERVARAIYVQTIVEEKGKPPSQHGQDAQWRNFSDRARAAIAALPPPATPQASDYEEVQAGHQRLVRALDVALNGEAGAAKQASLCDIVSQVAAGGWKLVRTPQAPEDVPDLATVEFEAARAIVRVAGAQVRAFTLANRNEKALALAMEINRAFVSRAHLLATPVTVTTEEIITIWGAMKRAASATDAAGQLDRVLGDRIQIAGEGPK